MINRMVSMPMTSLADALAAGPVVLDGGLSNQLEAAGHDLSDELWSARLLAEEPEAVAQAHAAYFAAGAQVAITASYQATFEGFARKGIGREQAARLLRRSVELARHARDTTVSVSSGQASQEPDLSVSNGQLEQHHGLSFSNGQRDEGTSLSVSNGQRDEGTSLSFSIGQHAGDPILSVSGGRLSDGRLSRRWVAASVGPYGAMLADGSEYRGRYGLSVGQLELFHRGRIETLAAAAPDVLALETIPDADEAEALLRIVASLGVPAWLSYTIDGDRTRAGQPLAEAFALAADVDSVIAVGVNCCAPSDVEHAVKVAAETTGKPVVVYPNSGEAWDAAARAWQGPSTFDPRLVRSWVAAGARLVGGCCRVGPAGIAAIREALHSA